MDAIYRGLMVLHGCIGALALASYWVTAFARKGSPLHVNGGRTYLVSMLGICATAAPMAVATYVRGDAVSGSFLAYLVVITATAMWTGYRAIRLKRSQVQFRGGAYGIVGAVNLASGVAVLVLGLATGTLLLSGFSLIGIVVGGGMLRRLRRPMPDANWWLQEHYGAMLGCGIATHVAFLSIGINSLAKAAGWNMPENFALVAWALPVVVAMIAGRVLNRQHVRPQRTA